MLMLIIAHHSQQIIGIPNMNIPGSQLTADGEVMTVTP